MPTATQTLRLTVLDTLRRGPVLIVVDGSHPKHVGLPESVRTHGHALLVPVADSADRVDLTEEAWFRLRYFHDGKVLEATIDWGGVFAMIGTNILGAAGGLVGGPGVPAWFGGPPGPRAQAFIMQLTAPAEFAKRKFTPVPLCGLRAPPDANKLQAIQRCQRLGKALIIVDLRKLRPERVPEALRDRSIAVLQVDFPGSQPATSLSRSALSVEVREQGMKPTTLNLPWDAILAVVSEWHWQRAYVWPDDYPEEMLTWTMHVHENIRDGSKPGQTVLAVVDPGGLALGCTADAQGHWALSLAVPVGPAGPEGLRPRYFMSLPADLPVMQ